MPAADPRRSHRRRRSFPCERSAGRRARERQPRERTPPAVLEDEERAEHGAVTPRSRRGVEPPALADRHRVMGAHRQIGQPAPRSSRRASTRQRDSTRSRLPRSPRRRRSRLRPARPRPRSAAAAGALALPLRRAPAATAAKPRHRAARRAHGSQRASPQAGSTSSMRPSMLADDDLGAGVAASVATRPPDLSVDLHLAVRPEIADGDSRACRRASRRRPTSCDASTTRRRSTSRRCRGTRRRRRRRSPHGAGRTKIASRSAMRKSTPGGYPARRRAALRAPAAASCG